MRKNIELIYGNMGYFVSSERTLEDYFYERNTLHLQSDGKMSLVHLLNLLEHGCFGPCQSGK